jgi:hypothetical protein
MTVTGETQTFDHVYDLTDAAHPKDSLTIEGDPKQTAQNFGTWGRYTKAVARLADAQGEAAFMAQLEYGVEYEVSDMDLVMLSKALKKYGRAMPEDPDEQKALWLVYFGLSRMDKNMLGVELQIATMGKLVDPNQVEQFRVGIRGKVSKLATDALSEAFSRIGELGGEAEISPVAGSEGVAQDSK